MKDLKEIVGEQTIEPAKSDFKYKFFAVVAVIILLYAAYHAMHLDFKVLTVLNDIMENILGFMYKIINVPADFLRRLWLRM